MLATYPPRVQAIIEDIYRGEVEAKAAPRRSAARKAKTAPKQLAMGQKRPDAIACDSSVQSLGYSRIAQIYMTSAGAPVFEAPLSREERRLGVLATPSPDGHVRPLSASGRRAARARSAPPEDIIMLHPALRYKHDEARPTQTVPPRNQSPAVLTVRALREELEGAALRGDSAVARSLALLQNRSFAEYGADEYGTDEDDRQSGAREDARHHGEMKQSPRELKTSQAAVEALEALAVSEDHSNCAADAGGIVDATWTVTRVDEPEGASTVRTASFGSGVLSVETVTAGTDGWDSPARSQSRSQGSRSDYDAIEEPRAAQTCGQSPSLETAEQASAEQAHHEAGRHVQELEILLAQQRETSEALRAALERERALFEQERASFVEERVALEHHLVLAEAAGLREGQQGTTQEATDHVLLMREAEAEVERLTVRESDLQAELGCFSASSRNDGVEESAEMGEQPEALRRGQISALQAELRAAQVALEAQRRAVTDAEDSVRAKAEAEQECNQLRELERARGAEAEALPAQLRAAEQRANSYRSDYLRLVQRETAIVHESAQSRDELGQKVMELTASEEAQRDAVARSAARTSGNAVLRDTSGSVVFDRGETVTIWQAGSETATGSEARRMELEESASRHAQSEAEFSRHRGAFEELLECQGERISALEARLQAAESEALQFRQSLGHARDGAMEPQLYERNDHEVRPRPEEKRVDQVEQEFHVLQHGMRTDSALSGSRLEGFNDGNDDDDCVLPIAARGELDPVTNVESVCTVLDGNFDRGIASGKAGCCSVAQPRDLIDPSHKDFDHQGNKVRCPPFMNRKLHRCCLFDSRKQKGMKSFETMFCPCSSFLYWQPYH